MLAPKSICNIFKVLKPKSHNHNKNLGHVVTKWGKYVGLAAEGRQESSTCELAVQTQILTQWIPGWPGGFLTDFPAMPKLHAGPWILLSAARTRALS